MNRFTIIAACAVLFASGAAAADVVEFSDYHKELYLPLGDDSHEHLLRAFQAWYEFEYAPALVRPCDVFTRAIDHLDEYPNLERFDHENVVHLLDHELPILLTKHGCEGFDLAEHTSRLRERASIAQSQAAQRERERQARMKEQQATQRRNEMERQQRRREQIVAACSHRKGAEASTCIQKITRGDVFVGMNEAEAQLSWGPPRRRNRTISGSGEDQQWVYPDGYLYFRDGIVYAIQVSE